MEFVVVWAVSKDESDCWIMVKNGTRGWELPGGSLEPGESPEEAALRELYEETGVLGIAKSIEYELIPRGCVVLVHVEGSVDPEPWISPDEAIEEVGWCFQLPENTAWGEQEIKIIRSHDWSTSISLES